MRQIKTILAPTDLSEFSKIGVGYALALAKAVGAELTVYHVVDYENLIEDRKQMKENARREGIIAKLLPKMVKTTFDPYGQASAAPAVSRKSPKEYQMALRRFLKENFSDLLPEVNLREQVALGRRDERIVEEAKEQATDLIVMSTHGRSEVVKLRWMGDGVTHALKGSVTERVIRNASCPVLAIGPESFGKLQEKLTYA